MRPLFACCVMLFSVAAQCAELRIPAHTVYLNPDGRSPRISPDQGVSRWMDPGVKLQWYGQMKQGGDLTASVSLRLPADASSSLKLTVSSVENPDQKSSTEVTVKGKQDGTVTADFGSFKIADKGYVLFELQSQNPAGKSPGNITELVLDGSATADAHFNLKPRRNAASVHLQYPEARGKEVSAFYCEMTGLEDPIWTYYMSCGWHRGYFGMQVNSPTERRIIFSVWDSGGEAIDRNKVADENRVTLVDKGEDVYSGSFGNEGTGGHSHLKFQWKTGEKQKFLVTAEPVSATQTIYAGYYFRPDLNEWMLISSWKAPKEGGYMRGLYSFSENFVGRNGHIVRKALYGNQWIRTSDGEWKEMTTARFSHDVTGRADRFDRFMGVEDGQFYLSHGGFVKGFTEYGKPYSRPASSQSPADMKLPPLPPVRSSTGAK